jgi:phospholipid/cholesterol/gamma-HCH transport system permease protein
MSDNMPGASLSEDRQQLSLHGDWSGQSLPDLRGILTALGSREQPMRVDVAQVSVWDPRLSALLLRLERELGRKNRRMELIGAPASEQQLLALATAVSPYQEESGNTPRMFSTARLRTALADIGDSFLDSLEFLGAALHALARSLLGRGALRRRELLGSLFQAGPQALGIITLTSILVGMILAYLGAAQLQQFGAAIYVADLVAIGMLREMGALMTAVVMAGRTGAAYAAQLSTMQGNEEIDAISTLGINPMEYLVVPRILALVCMMPLLVIFADALGIIGGAMVAIGMGVTPLQYFSELESAVSASHFLVGIGKSLVFATLIAVAGCREGISAGRNSEAVGKATTDAVVTAVVYLIIADAGINIICQQLGW